MAGKPLIELLDSAHHDRSRFSCGVEALDRYLQSQAGQDARRRVAAPYVLLEPPSPLILGFYTLSNASIQAAELPSTLTRKLPRYPVLPATLLGEGREGESDGPQLLVVQALSRYSCLRFHDGILTQG